MGSLLAFLLGLAIYFLPTIIGNARGVGGLFWWNLLLGWSGIVWLVLLVLSLVR
jgi:hypothetical protein